MGELKHIQIFDKTGFRKNIADITRDYDNKNIESFMISYYRKDGSIRSYWNGAPAEMLLLNRTFERDVIENHFPNDESESFDFDKTDGG